MCKVGVEEIDLVQLIWRKIFTACESDHKRWLDGNRTNIAQYRRFEGNFPWPMTVKYGPIT